METRDVYVFVFDSLADWEVGHVIGHVNAPEFQKHPGRYRVRSVGSSRAPVVTTGGLTIVPDLTLSELDPARAALLILPGGSAWDQREQGEVLALVLKLRAAGVPIAAICGATAGLARVGLLDDVAHTSNALQYLEQQPRYGGRALYREERAVRDRGIITAGSTASVDFARAVFEELDLYTPRVLEAWHGLFSTGEARYYFELVQATQA